MKIELNRFVKNRTKKIPKPRRINRIPPKLRRFDLVICHKCWLLHNLIQYQHSTCNAQNILIVMAHPTLWGTWVESDRFWNNWLLSCQSFADFFNFSRMIYENDLFNYVWLKVIMAWPLVSLFFWYLIEFELQNSVLICWPEVIYHYILRLSI